MLRCILHLDIDAFLASIEQIVEPSLRGRPVVVGSGVVASRSYEAKARGVQTAMGMVEARRRCPELVVRDGDAARAERFRQRVATVLRGFTPVVEICSLDDLYGDLTGLPELGPIWTPLAAQALAARIRAAVMTATGLSVAQGIGTSRVVARMATRHAKPGRIHVVAPGDEMAFVGAHALHDLPGVGGRTAELLEGFNLATVADLRQLDVALLERILGARGVQLHWRAQGRDGDPGSRTPAVVESAPVQSISRETSFTAVLPDGDGEQFLAGMLAYLLDRAAAELRRQALACRTVQVRVRHVDGAQGEVGRALPAASDRTDELFAMARPLLTGLLARRVLVRLVGVTLLRLGPARAPAPVLFADPALRRHELFTAVDRIRGRHGFGKVVLGASTFLLGKVAQTRDGFRLRTPSLTK